MGLIEDYVRANILAGEDGNFNDRFIAFLARSFIVDGSPEGVIAAPPGAAAWNIQGGAGTTLYVKESGTGNTGWVGYGVGGGGGGFTQEQIEDIVGAMVSANTETGISVTYDDVAAPGKLNFVAEVTQAELDAHNHTGTYDPAGTAAAAVATHEGAGDPHAQYATNTDLTNHEAAADPHAGYQKESEKGNANGYASLDAGGTVPDAQIPAAIARDSEVTTAVSNHEAAADPHTGYTKESNAGRVIGIVSADATFNNSVADNTLASVTIPGGTVAVGDTLRFIVFGDMLNNTGANVTFTWRLHFGATTVFTSPALSVATSGTRRKIASQVDIVIESTTAQAFMGRLTVSDLNASGGWSGSLGAVSVEAGSGTAAEDTATDKAVALSCQMGTASVNAEVKMIAASLVLQKLPV